tara:strand:+ start:5174 stop:5905 length:732 start_codon:yes stop_codon:yes gene_type:complete
VKNVITSLERTLNQLFDPAFLKVFIWGILTTLVAIVITWALASHLKSQIVLTQFDWQWVNDAFQWLLEVDWIFNVIFFFLMGIFFPPIATVFMSLYLDDIVDAVEGKYYTDRLAGKRLGMGHLAYLAIRLALFIVLLNIVVIPLYIMFFWVPFVPLIIFYTLNSYLLGWGYYEMVAVRHLGIKEAGRHRKSIRAQVLIGGFAVTLLYSVPVLNLAAPILGAAILTHIFHLSLQQPRFAESAVI